MSIKPILRFLRHCFLPHESNNQKAKLLHSSSLFLISLLLFSYQLTLYLIPKTGVKVLGYAVNISVDEVVRLTNDKRVQAGLAPLTVNPELVAAAKSKGADMIARDYWAHVAPDGTEPWKFISDAGYKYRYAGENLARDFSTASSAVEAWMASPSHKENLLSPKYKEIGIAVVEGDLAGTDATIIVQMFGTKYADIVPAVPQAKAQTEAVTAVVPQVKTYSVSPFTSTKNLSLLVVGVLLIVLIADGIIISRKNIARVGGKSFAHISFLGMIAAIILILKAGEIL